ncbi:MAG: hypothetical protein CGW95_11575, partial [Phenylobacterium zucineum]
MRLQIHSSRPHRPFWTAFTDIPHVQQVQENLADILLEPPSLHDFMAAIKGHKGSTAPGATGLTYNMLKAWPDDTITSAYHCLALLWRSNSTPDWLKWCWLCPKPKDPEAAVSLDGLRPLMLIEVIRKAWVGVTITKITSCWERHQILSPIQHGFRRGRGTDTALVEFINAREHAEEHHLPLYTSSWDIRRAFDSVSKSVMEFSWLRLGVPKHVASWLAHMDDDGATVIRSPWALSCWHKQKYAGFTDTLGGRQPATFTRIRGTPQGDVSSPHNWAAIFDIAARALEKGRDPTHTAMAPGALNTMYQVGDPGYADDLASLTATLEGLQRTADIMSAFAILLDLELSIAKLRVGVFNSCSAKPEFITVHTSGWTPHTLQLKTTGTIKLLGVLFDLDGQQKTQKVLTHQRLLRACTIMASQRSVDSVALTATISAMTRASYTATHSPWSSTD